MNNQSNTREYIEQAYEALKQRGQKPTVRAVQAFIVSGRGVGCSTNEVTKELKRLRELDEVEGANQVQGEELSEVVSEESLENLDPIKLSARVSLLEGMLELAQKEVKALRKTIKKQNESLLHLNSYHSERVEAIAKDALVSLIESQQLLSNQTEQLIESRQKDKETWDGLKRFLMEETDRIRNEEQGKRAILEKRTRELEDLNTALTQAKNSAYEQIGQLRGKIEALEKRRND